MNSKFGRVVTVGVVIILAIFGLNVTEYGLMDGTLKTFIPLAGGILLSVLLIWFVENGDDD